MRSAELKVASLFSIVILGIPSVFAAERTWTRSEVLAIADAEATRLGYDIERMSVSFDAPNSLWNSGTRDYLLKASDMHQGFWAVYYADFPEPRKGGWLWVLVGKESRMVIQTLQGK